MPITLTCKHCGTAIIGESEDDLVALVQAHARTHEGGLTLTREHILSRLHRLQNHGAAEDS